MNRCPTCGSPSPYLYQVVQNQVVECDDDYHRPHVHDPAPVGQYQGWPDHPNGPTDDYESMG